MITYDDLGPMMIATLHEPHLGLQAFVVIDNLAAGTAIGGVRMAPDVTVEEVARLARAMTLKSAAAGLPHGGAKAGIVADPLMDRSDKERLMRAFARAIKDLTGYVPGPDMGTDETCMAWVYDEIGRAVGLPSVLGGIPLDEIGATGFGLAACAEGVQATGLLELSGARVVVQGFGAVGRNAARFLVERGAVLVGASDRRGGVENSDGLDVERLVAITSGGGSVSGYPDGSPATPEDLLAADCDIWIPAARPDVFTADNAWQVKARVIIQGANIPATAEAEQVFHERGVLSVPDFIANAGGVICAAVEHRGGGRAEALATIREKVLANTTAVVRDAADRGIPVRRAAEELALRRLHEAQSYRRRW